MTIILKAVPLRIMFISWHRASARPGDCGAAAQHANGMMIVRNMTLAPGPRIRINPTFTNKEHGPNGARDDSRRLERRSRDYRRQREGRLRQVHGGHPSRRGAAAGRTAG